MEDLRVMGLDRHDLIAFAILCGCDYTEGIRGIGIVSAMEIRVAFGGGMEGLESFKLWWTSSIADPDHSVTLRKLVCVAFLRILTFLAEANRPYRIGPSFPTHRCLECIHASCCPPVSPHHLVFSSTRLASIVFAARAWLVPHYLNC